MRQKNHNLIQGILNKTENGWMIIHVDDNDKEFETAVHQEDAIKLVYEEDEGKEVKFILETSELGFSVAKIIF